jgi:hypothetical protein
MSGHLFSLVVLYFNSRDIDAIISNEKGPSAYFDDRWIQCETRYDDLKQYWGKTRDLYQKPKP